MLGTRSTTYSENKGPHSRGPIDRTPRFLCRIPTSFPAPSLHFAWRCSSRRKWLGTPRPDGSGASVSLGWPNPCPWRSVRDDMVRFSRVLHGDGRDTGTIGCSRDPDKSDHTEPRRSLWTVDGPS